MSETNRIVEAKKFLNTAEEQILIISPYMTPSTLAEVLSEIPAGIDVTVICSWRTDDLLFGSSKLETYELCKDKGWSLRVDYDGMPRTIHLKAYVIDGEMAMVGSANMTQRGMLQNIESLIPVSLEAHSTLADSIEDSIAGSKLVDDEVCRQFVEHLSSIPKPEKSQTKRLTVVYGDMEQEILKRMPPQPSLDDLISLPSIRKALSVRGLRFGEIRRVLRRNSTRGSARNTINDRTMNLMQEIVEVDSRLDIQKRYGSNCLVWKVHPILNKKIMSILKPYLGKPIRELGLDENLWDDDTLGSKTAKIRQICMELLPIEIRECVENLSTWQGTLRLKKGDQALYPRPFGPRLQFTTEGGELLRNVSPSVNLESLLPEERIRDELWLPAFCLFEADKGAKLGDVVLRGFGLWESDRNFVASMERDFDSDIEILSKQSGPFFDNPFRKSSETEVIHTKVAALGGKTEFPLGHPERPMSRYLNTGCLTNIAHEILSHDH